MEDSVYPTATELADRIARKEISPVEVVDRSLARIEATHSKINAFCFVYADEARARARQAEQDVMLGRPLGPLHGVPVAFKDMTPTRGKRTTLGSRLYEHWVPDHDAVVVERLTGAGAIVVGKTTTSELAATGITETNLWGITRNPWNTAHTPGGSSGGSGAAVAAGCVPLAEGCDMGGSIRIPAAFCGIVGLKPSFGRIPFDILPSKLDTYCHFGPLARSVDDAALFLSVAQGRDDRDISSLPMFGEFPRRAPVMPKGLRIALSIDLGYYRVDAEIERNLRMAATCLRNAGAVVEEVSLGLTRDINDIGYQHWNAYIAALVGPRLEQWRDQLDPVVVKMVEEGRKMDAVTLKRLEFARSEQWARFRPLFDRYDVLLCPTASMAAPLTGVSDLDFGYDDASGRYVQYEMTFPFNLFSNCPALSVPSGLTASGLPTAAQIVGRPFDDATVLGVGGILERSDTLKLGRPPL